MIWLAQDSPSFSCSSGIVIYSTSSYSQKHPGSDGNYTVILPVAHYTASHITFLTQSHKYWTSCLLTYNFGEDGNHV